MPKRSSEPIMLDSILTQNRLYRKGNTDIETNEEEESVKRFFTTIQN